MKIPYGVADFERMRTGGYAYVDRTAYIREIEDMADVILFVRPRRFDKSLWLRTLMAYYDLLTADRQEELFSGLAVGDDPTPLRCPAAISAPSGPQTSSASDASSRACDSCSRSASAFFRACDSCSRSASPFCLSASAFFRACASCSRSTSAFFRAAACQAASLAGGRTFALVVPTSWGHNKGQPHADRTAQEDVPVGMERSRCERSAVMADFPIISAAVVAVMADLPIIGAAVVAVMAVFPIIGAVVVAVMAVFPIIGTALVAVMANFLIIGTALVAVMADTPRIMVSSTHLASCN